MTTISGSAPRVKRETALDKMDKEVEKMVQTWDIVKCKYCGRKISMLSARPVNNGEYFVCSTHD